MRCTAYCTAASYNARKLFEKLKDHYPATLYRDAVHVVAASHEGNVFLFSYGVIVFWGLSEEEELAFIESVSPLASEPLRNYLIDSYDFSYGELPRIQRDELILTNQDILTKLAISYGLAQSTKLAMFEEVIDKTIENSKQLPKDLAEKGKIFLSRKQISKKIGALFLDKSSVNLHSDILDEPDFFWEYPEHHPLYRDVFKCLDIGPRLEVLNKRLEILGELLEILNDQLNHQHSSILELTIIWLIVIEVILTLSRDLFHFI